MNASSLTSEYCDNVAEELDKIAVGEVNSDIEEVLKHFNILNKKLKELSNNYKCDIYIDELVYLYSKENDYNTKERILERILEISEVKINNILLKYYYLNIQYEDLRNIIVENIKFSISNNFSRNDNELSERIQRDIDKYLSNKENERSLKL